MSGAFGLSDVAYVGAVGSVAAFDPNAQAYITAVETADGQALEAAVRTAINDFVVGCKADGIWAAIKASCILAGARTLNGALQPLVGTAPTNFNFLSPDYNRKTGLLGDGSAKYLDSNRASNADPVNSLHHSVYATSTPSGGTRQYISDRSVITSANQSAIVYTSSNQTVSGFSRSTSSVNIVAVPTGFLGTSRNSSASFLIRVNSVNTSQTAASTGVTDNTVKIFTQGGFTQYLNARLAFYSIGESLDLALLDARVTALINAFGAAIP